MTALRLPRSPRLMIAAALCAMGLGVVAAPSDAQARHDQHRNDGTRCVAGAVTAFGTVLPDTRAREVRVRPRAACRVAVNRCHNRLERLRDRTGRAFPFARCQVLRREVASNHGGPRHAAPAIRCTAEAFTRRGRPIGQTRASETRRVENRACQAALNTCENRLDRQRDVTGRGFRRARCEVVRTRSAHASQVPHSAPRHSQGRPGLSLTFLGSKSF